MKKLTSLCVNRRLIPWLSAACVCLAMSLAPTARADSGVTAQHSVESHAGRGTVRGDRCNVRARPSRTAEVVVQLNRGDGVEVLERRSMTEQGKEVTWLRIALPPAAKCYVSSKFVSEGLVTGDAVNVRCGPGASYREVGKLSKGDRVEVIKTEGEWSQIKPTTQCTGWISADLVDVEAQPAFPSPVAQLGSPDIFTRPMSVPAEPAPAIPMVVPVDIDPELQVQYVVKDGILRASTEPTAEQWSYELMTLEVGRRQYRIAYLDAPGINLDRFEGKHVRVLGNQRWRKGERFPIITVERVDMVW